MDWWNENKWINEWKKPCKYFVCKVFKWRCQHQQCSYSLINMARNLNHYSVWVFHLNTFFVIEFHWESFMCVYAGCPRRNGQNFGRVFLMLKYTDITQNTYIQSSTVMEIMAREVWKYDSCYTLTDYQIHIKTGRNMWFL